MSEYGEKLIHRVTELIGAADRLGYGKDRIICLHPTDSSQIEDTLNEKLGRKYPSSRLFGMPVFKCSRYPVGEICIMPITLFNELYGTNTSFVENEIGKIEKDR